MSVRELFFELLLISLGQRESFSVVPDARQWEMLFETAEKQALIGITSVAVGKLEGEQKPPLELYLQWLLLAEKIADSNKKFLDNERKMHRAFLERGLHCCFLKGQGNAAYYPDPALRQSGDIDVWVEGSREMILKAFSGKYHDRNVFYHHFEAKLFRDTKVEVHFTPSWMNSPFTNRKLQDYFTGNSSLQFSNYDEKMGFCVPEKEFACVYSFIHSFRHLFSEGVGLRQLMDCHFIVSSLERNERESVMEELKTLGLAKFTAAVMYVLQEVFALKDECLLCSPDPERGKVILEDAIVSGNFGKYGKDTRRMTGSESIVVRGWYRMKRLLRFFELNPSESLWAPVFKVWQRLWRRKFRK